MKILIRENVWHDMTDKARESLVKGGLNQIIHELPKVSE